MSNFKLSLITTVFNEEKNIQLFIKSIASQTLVPQEIIIVDGGSSDQTVANIKYQIANSKYKKRFKILTKKGNRSVGRNEAIKQANGDIILCSDAGCILDKNWVKNISKPFEDKKVDVAAGYYKGKASSVFEKSFIPYVLVMEDKIDPKKFLPATRSMAFKKTVWETIGGFDESLSHNEDYDFANKIKKNRFNIFFAKDAVVNWLPRKNIAAAFKMFLRFAYGDAEAKIFREKVIYIFLRYAFFIYLLILSLVIKSIALYLLLFSAAFVYLAWSILKNYKYVRDIKAIIYLSFLQITSDFAVIIGTFFGFLKSISYKNFPSIMKNYKFLVLIIIVYIASILSTLSFGIPNLNHPFNYNMDEWHQSQSVRNLFVYGSPNIEGSANGSVFHFFLSGIYLIPVYILNIINPFAINSAVTELTIQSRLFEILRINTLIFGVLSIILFAFISRKYFKINPVISTFLFTFNPLFLMLSGYFKYDIALIFWILISFFLFLRYSNSPSFFNFLITGISCSLAISTKISALPLLPIYIISFFLFHKDSKKYIKHLISGLFIFSIVFAFFGIPDIILGKGNLYEYLVSNLSTTPSVISSNLNLGISYWQYFLLHLYPSTFGAVLYFSFLLSIFFGIYFILKKSNFLTQENKFFTTLLLFLIFFSLSLVILRTGAIGNRILPTLPFMVIFLVYVLSHAIGELKNNILRMLILIFVFFLLMIQLFQTYTWYLIKISPSPQETSSKWILNNIAKGSVIGIENIPIYQSLPDVVLKEFYSIQYNKKEKTKYSYQVINSTTLKLPRIIILTNEGVESKYLLDTDKKRLKERLLIEGYRKKVEFNPRFYYLKFFSSELDYYMSGLSQNPNAIAVYAR